MSARRPHSAGVVSPRATFAEFFETEYPRLLRVLSPAGARAEDALQEAFSRAAVAWRRIGRYDDPAGWVRLVAVRRLLDERRSEGRRAAAIERLGATLPLDTDHDRAIDITAAIRHLPTRQRVALVLFYLDGLTSAEVGAVMGISAGAVRFHLHEARKRLRPLLEVRDG